MKLMVMGWEMGWVNVVVGWDWDCLTSAAFCFTIDFDFD